jgi:hypothetical protein
MFVMSVIFDLLMEYNAFGATYSSINLQQPVKIKLATCFDDVNTHHTSTSKTNDIDHNMRHD